MAHLLPFVSVQAFHKLYVFKHYPKFDLLQKRVIEEVTAHPYKKIRVDLTWYNGDYSSNTYIYQKLKHIVSISTDKSILFQNHVVVPKAIKKAADWFDRPDWVLGWQIWPAHVTRIVLLPENEILAQNDTTDFATIPFDLHNEDYESYIYQQSLAFQKDVQNVFFVDERKADPVQLAQKTQFAAQRYEQFFVTIVWSVYQRVLQHRAMRTLETRLVWFVEQLFYYMRAVSIKYGNDAYFWLDAFTLQNGAAPSLNCLGITVLFCAILETLGYFPQLFSARFLEGHITLVYRPQLNAPLWYNLDLTVSGTNAEMDWVGRCKWTTTKYYNNRVLQNAQQLMAITALNFAEFVDASAEERQKLSGPLLDFVDYDILSLPERVFISSMLRNDQQCDTANLETDEEFQEILQYFRVKYESMDDSVVFNVFTCQGLWRYVKQNYTTAEIRDLNRKLKFMQRLMNREAIKHIPAPYPLSLLFPSVQAPMETESNQATEIWTKIYTLRDQVFQDPTISRPRMLDDYLSLHSKRTYSSNLSSSSLSPPRKTARVVSQRL